MRYRLVPAVLAAMLTLTLVACSDDSDSGDGDTTTTEASEDTTTTEAASTDTTSVDGEEPPVDDLEEALNELLITPEELGGSFVEAEYEETGENPCGIDVDAEYPADVQIGRVFSDDTAQLDVLHELRVYDSDAAALTAFEAGMESLTCGTSVDGSLTLSEPIDVSADVGADAFAIGLTGEGVEGVLVVVTYSDLISLYQFQGATGAADAAGAADPTAIVAANMEYIVTTIG